MKVKDITRYKKWAVEAGTEECWGWRGTKNPKGYGHFHYKFRPHRAHRIAWEIVNGPIPEGMYVLHTCDNPSCCNPKHLFLGTAKDNAYDAMRKGRNSRHEVHGMHRLTKDDVSVIRALCCIGVRQRVVAALYGTSQANVNDIHLKKIWKGI